MGRSKRAVLIHLVAQGDSIGEGQHKTVVNGEMVQVRETYYIRYEETEPDMQGTMTTVKVKKDELRIIRHGKVRSELVFIVGKRMGGNYASAAHTMRLETVTERLEISGLDGQGRDGRKGILAWDYRLIVDGADTGRFEMNMTIEEEKHV